MEQRYRHKATIITTNLDFEEWHNFLGNKALVDALLSRLRHQCHTIRIDGPSSREPEGWSATCTTTSAWPPKNFHFSLPALTAAETEGMDSRRAQPIPSALAICPRLRPRARHAVIEIRRLVATLIAAFPDSALLVRDPGAAERIDTTPFDHVAANVITAARTLCDAIAALADPP